jgi:hypothetical protein
MLLPSVASAVLIAASRLERFPAFGIAQLDFDQMRIRCVFAKAKPGIANGRRVSLGRIEEALICGAQRGIAAPSAKRLVNRVGGAVRAGTSESAEEKDNV